ncbi:HNH endonuclease [Terriglobus roseus]|nr:HNH endonuclease [Terriglobus roseus]
MKLTNIASLDPAIYLTGRKGLTGASKADSDMWFEMTDDWERFWLVAKQASDRVSENSPDVQTIVEPSEGEISYEGQTREAMARIRVGQPLFRESVLSAYDYKCCISGTHLRGLLVASHIIPWKADTKNRLNPRNGLCLSAIHDRAFDAGLITLAKDFTLLLSRALVRNDNAFLRSAFTQYEGQAISLPDKFPPDAEFLSYHRKEIFLQ